MPNNQFLVHLPHSGNICVHHRAKSSSKTEISSCSNPRNCIAVVIVRATSSATWVEAQVQCYKRSFKAVPAVLLLRSTCNQLQSEQKKKEGKNLVVKNLVSKTLCINDFCIYNRCLNVCPIDILIRTTPTCGLAIGQFWREKIAPKERQEAPAPCS